MKESVASINAHDKTALAITRVLLHEVDSEFPSELDEPVISGLRYDQHALYLGSNTCTTLANVDDVSEAELVPLSS